MFLILNFSSFCLIFNAKMLFLFADEVSRCVHVLLVLFVDLPVVRHDVLPGLGEGLRELQRVARDLEASVRLQNGFQISDSPFELAYFPEKLSRAVPEMAFFSDRDFFPDLLFFLLKDLEVLLVSAC